MSEGLGVLGSFSKTNRQKYRISRFGGLLILIIILAFCAACGKRKAQVKLPGGTPSTPAPAQGTGTPKQPAPSLPPGPAAAGKSGQPAVIGSKTPAAIVPTAEVSKTGPLIRIGLTTSAREIRISSSGGFYLMEKTPEAPRRLVRGEIQVRIEEEGKEPASVYQIQVASFSRPENADDLRDKLARLYDAPVSVKQNTVAGTHQVRVGEFATKEEAQEFLAILAADGYRDAFVTKEALAAGGGKPTLALRGSNELFLLNTAGFLFMPSSGTDFLRVDGKAYRGSFDIILNRSGRITVVNRLGMEEYLLGVVPAEMSPDSYPEFAALAALSIASRTYALYHIGQYNPEGFDLSDDTRTQVYEGVSAEKPAATEAVTLTSGLAIYYQDKVIDAMYMSTCGGRTEDFSNVFDAAPVPYLKSVLCAVESGPEKGAMVLEGKRELEPVFLADDGILANRSLALARILGLPGARSDSSAEFLAAPVETEEAIGWIAAARKIAQKPSSRDLPGRVSWTE